MRICALFITALVVVLGIGFRCSSPPPEPHLSGPLGVVRFPDPWVKLRGDEWVGVNDNIQYVVRRSPRGPAGGELLFCGQARLHGRAVRQGGQ
jgi:hypothetical protein